MREGRCSKFYPKRFRATTVVHGTRNGQLEYRRLQDGRTVVINNCIIDNRRIIPYNPYAAIKYNCHINFEICGSINTMKYLHKYVYKGDDCITVQVANSEEIENEQQQPHQQDGEQQQERILNWD